MYIGEDRDLGEVGSSLLQVMVCALAINNEWSIHVRENDCDQPHDGKLYQVITCATCWPRRCITRIQHV